QLNPQQQIDVLTGTAHVLHWSQPEKIAQLIGPFLQQAARVTSSVSATELDKRKVASSFSRAAHTYHSAANLQRAVCSRLIANLPKHDSIVRALDLGCGT